MAIRTVLKKREKIGLPHLQCLCLQKKVTAHDVGGIGVGATIRPAAKLPVVATRPRPARAHEPHDDTQRQARGKKHTYHPPPAHGRRSGFHDDDR